LGVEFDSWDPTPSALHEGMIEMRVRECLASALCLAALVFLPGCNPAGSYAHVHGIVTFNGAPVEEAKITFHSTAEAQGGKETFSTTTDSSGKYLIAGVGKLPGLPPGRYKVTVTKLTLKSGAKLPEDFDLTQLEMSGLGTNSLPKEYGAVETTKLSATLDSGKNEANFDLKGSK